MDDRRFDTLTKIMARPQPRRRLLGAIAAGLLGGLGGARLTAARPRVALDCYDSCVEKGSDPSACRVACRTCGNGGTENLCFGPDKDVTCCLPISGRICQPDGTCCQQEGGDRTCGDGCGPQTDDCGQTVDCAAFCTGEGGQCCDDGLCADGRRAVCCHAVRCEGECCENGECAELAAGETCCGGARCQGECRDGHCRTGHEGCLDPNQPCEAGRICLDNGTCLLPCGANASCPEACIGSTCVDRNGQKVCTTPTIVDKCRVFDDQCPYGSVCLNGRCFVAC